MESYEPWSSPAIFDEVVPLSAELPASTASSTGLRPQEIYDGGYSNDSARMKLRIACGGAGQSGLIGLWATAFIRYMVDSRGVEPFTVSTT